MDDIIGSFLGNFEPMNNRMISDALNGDDFWLSPTTDEPLMGTSGTGCCSTSEKCGHFAQTPFDDVCFNEGGLTDGQQAQQCADSRVQFLGSFPNQLGTHQVPSVWAVNGAPANGSFHHMVASDPRSVTVQLPSLLGPVDSAPHVMTPFVHPLNNLGHYIAVYAVQPSNDQPSLQPGINRVLLPPGTAQQKTSGHFNSVNDRGDVFNPNMASSGTSYSQGDTVDRSSSLPPILKKSRLKSTKGIGHPHVVKALSPYNFFFQFERNRILHFEGNGSRATSARDDCFSHYYWTKENTVDYQRLVLEKQWARDATVKRKHVKVHGCISFLELSRRVSTSWKMLPETAKDVFREISRRDHERYAREVLCRRSRIGGTQGDTVSRTFAA